MFWVDEPLFKDGDIKMLDQPLFTYYQKSLKDSNSDIKKKLSSIKEDKNIYEITKNQKGSKTISSAAKAQKNMFQKPIKKEKEIKNIPQKVKPKEVITKEIIKPKNQESQFSTANFGQRAKTSNLTNSNFKK